MFHSIHRAIANGFFSLFAVLNVVNLSCPFVQYRNTYCDTIFPGKRVKLFVYFALYQKLFSKILARFISDRSFSAASAVTFISPMRSPLITPPSLANPFPFRFRIIPWFSLQNWFWLFELFLIRQWLLLLVFVLLLPSFSCWWHPENLNQAFVWCLRLHLLQFWNYLNFIRQLLQGLKVSYILRNVFDFCIV